jgi:hypothetical protein
MLYDESRSVHAHFDADVGRAGLVAAVVIRDGIVHPHTHLRCKGYFSAWREGPNLRVAVDRLVSPPKW